MESLGLAFIAPEELSSMRNVAPEFMIGLIVNGYMQYWLILIVMLQGFRFGTAHLSFVAREMAFDIGNLGGDDHTTCIFCEFSGLFVVDCS